MKPLPAAVVSRRTGSLLPARFLARLVQPMKRGKQFSRSTARTIGNDPQISDAELVNEHYRLEAAIYEVEENLLLSDMRRFVRAETALSPSSLSFISKVKEFVRSAGDKFVRLGVRGSMRRL